MVLRNFVELPDGVPTRMHFTAHDFQDRVIRDPQTTREKTVTALAFQVDQLNREPVAATFSVVAEKLAVLLQPWTEGQRYLDVDLIITKRGTSFLTSFSVEPAPRG